MGASYLWGWDATPGAERWRKVLVNDEGKLIIDPSEIFENPPTEDEAGKAPTSEWAHDHDANVDAHHAQAHENTHVAGGADDIDSALAIAAMAALTTGKIWQGVANRPTEVAMSAGPTIATGSYTGNGADDRQITTGFKCSRVVAQQNLARGREIYGTLPNAIDQADGVADKTDLALHATDGFVVDNTIMNYVDQTYYYWAISE